MTAPDGGPAPGATADGPWIRIGLRSCVFGVDGRRGVLDAGRAAGAQVPVLGQFDADDAFDVGIATHLDADHVGGFAHQLVERGHHERLTTVDERLGRDGKWAERMRTVDVVDDLVGGAGADAGAGELAERIEPDPALGTDLCAGWPGLSVHVLSSSELLGRLGVADRIPNDTNREANETGIVTRIDVGDRSYLHMSDAGELTEYALLYAYGDDETVREHRRAHDRFDAFADAVDGASFAPPRLDGDDIGRPLDADVLVPSHHGAVRSAAQESVSRRTGLFRKIATEGSTRPFLETVSPDALVVQARLNNPNGYPHPRLMSRAERAGGAAGVAWTGAHGIVCDGEDPEAVAAGYGLLDSVQATLSQSIEGEAADGGRTVGGVSRTEAGAPNVVGAESVVRGDRAFAPSEVLKLRLVRPQNGRPEQVGVDHRAAARDALLTEGAVDLDAHAFAVTPAPFARRIYNGARGGRNLAAEDVLGYADVAERQLVLGVACGCVETGDWTAFRSALRDGDVDLGRLGAAPVDATLAHEAASATFGETRLPLFDGDPVDLEAGLRPPAEPDERDQQHAR